MSGDFEILPLQSLELNVILPIITGYETHEKYAVDKTETDALTVFQIRLVPLEKPYRKGFEDDFHGEDYQRYVGMLAQGYSFGVYHNSTLAAFAIGEAHAWNRSFQIWEFQVHPDYRRQGIGRALMDHVIARAMQDQFRIVFVETQNTNVPAIRFYRSCGFALEALDLSLYTNQDVEVGEVAFFMKRRLV